MELNELNGVRYRRGYRRQSSDNDTRNDPTRPQWEDKSADSS